MSTVVTFAAHEDFDVYPNAREEDRKKLESLGCDATFEPTSLYSSQGNGDGDHIVGKEQKAKEMHQTFVRVAKMEPLLCGITRPHFFRGVATVVAKLFNIVEPDIAVFGLKDYQQLQIIKTMVKELNFDIEILEGPIGREPDGLAMSSRNALLHPDIRPQCSVLYQGLKWAEASLQNDGYHSLQPSQVIEEIQDRIAKEGGLVDYVQIVDSTTLESTAFFNSKDICIALAAFFPSKQPNSTVRLIDNIQIKLYDRSATK